MFNKLNEEFEKALLSNPPDFAKAQELLQQGANINETQSDGSSIIEYFIHKSTYCECSLEECEDIGLVQLFDFFIQNGWDTYAFGLEAILTSVYTQRPRQMFDGAKMILNHPTTTDAEVYDQTLEGISTEESFQRCCEHRHDLENIYYAMYELVKAKKTNTNFNEIYPYYHAIGKKIDNIIYFSDIKKLNKTRSGFEFNDDIGFICENEVFLITSSLNILFNNNRMSAQPQNNISQYFGDGVIGSEITDISFGHKSVMRGTCEYGQPQIIIKLNSGKELKFTHNFGETLRKKIQRRFSIIETSTSKIIINRRNLEVLMNDIKLLNQELMNECIKDEPDLLRIEELLKLGANPLGFVSDGSDYDNLYTLLIGHFTHVAHEKYNDKDCDKKYDDSIFAKITELFLKYGMDIQNPEKPYDHEEILHPLWKFSFYDSETAFQSLKLLLDSGLDADSAGHCWSHDLTDLSIARFEIDDEEDPFFVIDFKRLMLFASYPHIINNDPYLQKEIWYNENNYDLTNFRRWNDFEYIFEPTVKNDLSKSIVRIIEKSTQKEVWKFGFEISPDEARNL